MTALRVLRHQRDPTGTNGLNAIWSRAVADYGHHVRGHANHALHLSTRDARHAFSAALLPRLGFRTVLRVAEAVPPDTRAVFPAAPAGSAR